MFEDIKAIAKDVLGLDLDTIDMDTCLSDMNIDSMDAVELFLAFETEFDIEIPDDFAPDTVGDIVRFVEDAANYRESEEDDEE